MTGDIERPNRSVNRRIEIRDDPSVYRPKRGDILEFCPHIRIQVTAVTSNGKVSLRDLQPRPPEVDTVIHLDGRPDPDPNRVPPLGITTWASEGGTVSTADLQRLLRHDWELK